MLFLQFKSMPVHASVLQQFALLRHFPEATLQDFAAHASLQQLARREVMVNRDTPPVALYFLLEGRLQATDFTLDGKEVGLYFLEEGQYFGEVAMLDGLTYAEIIMANKKSQVVMVPNRIIRPHIIEHSQAIEAIGLGLARRLREQTRQRQILSINNPLQRICAQILLLSQQTSKPSRSAPHATETIMLTHQELAMMVNLSRETVTRAFQTLQLQGVLDRQADGLVVHLQKIRSLAHQEE
jgi:CRP/FNR family transcriptional regulator, cyclic AMP receptor protein